MWTPKGSKYSFCQNSLLLWWLRTSHLSSAVKWHRRVDKNWLSLHSSSDSISVVGGGFWIFSVITCVRYGDIDGRWIWRTTVPWGLVLRILASPLSCRGTAEPGQPDVEIEIRRIRCLRLVRFMTILIWIYQWRMRGSEVDLSRQYFFENDFYQNQTFRYIR